MNCSILSRRRAFTLTETLVVVVILTVLMGLLIPTLQRVRSLSRSTQCVSNLRQWAVLFSTYMGNNNGMFPEADPFHNGTSWQHPDAPLNQDASAAVGIKNWYSGNSLVGCPEHDTTVTSWIITRRYYSYVYNNCLGYKPISINTINRRSDVMILTDASKTQGNVTAFGNLYGQDKRIGFVHNGKSNALFVDGHVESISTYSIPINIEAN